MNKADIIISPKWLLSQKNNSLLDDHSIFIEGNIIKDILPNNTAFKIYDMENRTILNDHIVLPGLINCYHNSALTLFKNSKRNNDKCKNKTSHESYIEKYSEKHKALSAQLLIAEMIKNGITTFCDDDIFPNYMIDEITKAKIRCCIGLKICKKKTEWANNEDESLNKALRIFDDNKNNPDIKFFFNPVSVNDVSEGMFQKISKIANELDIPIRMSINTSKKEINECIKHNKCRPLDYIEKFDILNNKFTALNTLILNLDDIKLLEKYRSNLVINKTTQLLSAEIIINRLLERKINVILSTGVMGNYSDSNILDEMTILSLLSNIKKTELNTNTILKMVTINPALSLGLDQNIGMLAQGYLADIVSINIKNIIQKDSVSYNGIEKYLKSSNIDNLWISGRHVLKNYKLLTLEENKMYDRFRKIKELVNKDEY